MTWYALLRVVHSYWRWAVLLAAVVILARAVAGARQRRDWTDADSRAARFFATALDIQFTLGMILNFGFSPFFSAMVHSWDETMGEMSRAKRAPSGPARHRAMRTTLIVFFLIVLVGIPWPWRPYGRPLFRTSW